MMWLSRAWLVMSIMFVAPALFSGYEALFSLGELDPAFADKQILLADKLNGKPLSKEEGLFELSSRGKDALRGRSEWLLISKSYN